jgi:hypothetical protein
MRPRASGYYTHVHQSPGGWYWHVSGPAGERSDYAVDRATAYADMQRALDRLLRPRPDPGWVEVRS